LSIKSCVSEEEQSEVISTVDNNIEEAAIVTEMDPVLTSNLPGNEFPLLCSLGIHSEKHMDSLIQEIVKFNGGKVIKYMQANNRTGFLLPMPSSQNTERFLVEFGKRGSIVDDIMGLITSSAQCSKEEAAECLIVSVFNKFEETFVKVAMDKGVMPNVHRKMDAARTEAMLCKTGLNTKNSRILFKHLNQFFGPGFFESEKKRHDYLAGQDFPPKVDRMILPDKTTVHYWYKRPDELMKQLERIISAEQIDGLKRVDFTLGGDHGGGKFRVTLKLLLRFHSKKTFSRLFQIASVSHSKDDISILKTTVLNPIGEGL
jgi:hypothetical protein